MINSFTAYNPVKLHFGENSIEMIGEAAQNYGHKALLITGGGSVKKFGYFKKVSDQLQSAGVDFVEYGGIKPNPRIEDVRQAVAFGKKENVEMIIAVGGGSVVDSAKVISLSIASEEDGWDLIKRNVKPRSALPLICVLTLAATGTEMNAAAVVQDNESGEKNGFVNELMFPKESFLDPSFTVSVPKNYTAYGIVDLIAHALEAYFGKGEPQLTDSITFEIIKDAMTWGPALLADLSNVELRANIMLDATMALNGITQYGKSGGDWGVHSIGHELSLLYDLPHGATLSIAYPAWLTFHKNLIPDRIKKMGQHLFNTTDPDRAISGLRSFFSQIESPVSLSEVSIKKSESEKILGQMIKNKVSGMHHILTENDYPRLIELMY